MAVVLGKTFGQAFCEWFDLKEVFDIQLNSTVNTLFSATIKKAITAEDLIGIGQIMKRDEVHDSAACIVAVTRN